MSKQQMKTTEDIAKELIKQEKKQKKQQQNKVKDDDGDERQKIIWKIKKYLASPRFGEYITKELGIKYTQAQLQRMSQSTLQNILSRIRVSVDMKNTDSLFERMTKGGALAMETSAGSMGYNIDGFADELFRNEEFLNALEKTKIEADLPTIPPPVQMLLIASQVAFICHTKNRIKQSALKQKKQDVVIQDEPVREMKPPTIAIGEII